MTGGRERSLDSTDHRSGGNWAKDSSERLRSRLDRRHVLRVDRDFQHALPLAGGLGAVTTQEVEQALGS